MNAMLNMSRNEAKETLNNYNLKSQEVSGNIQWRFGQVKSPFINNIISCVEFNHDGELLAVGGINGQIVIYKRMPFTKSMFASSNSYNLYSHFQSHTIKFDCLKSMEIEEKINKICWLQRNHFINFLLTTNEKTIKLWKLKECDKTYDDYNRFDENSEMRKKEKLTSLRFPRLKNIPMGVKASPSRIYENLHDYHIHSISLNSDQETFLSADDLRINVWHMNVTDRSFNIVDIKPSSMADLTEIITAAEFHPSECNVFVYSSSGGAIRLCDMRSSALCERYSKEFKDMDGIIGGYELHPLNSIKISPSGRFLMARDYINVKVYDLRKENQILEKYAVHDFLRGNRFHLYETQRIFDRFDCCWSGNDDYIMTGSYNNFFKIFDRTCNSDVMLEAKRERVIPKALMRPRRISTKHKLKSDEIHVDFIDYDNKIQFTAWHPEKNLIAVAAKNDLFIYKETV